MADDYTVIEVSPGELVLEREGIRTRLFVAIDGDTRWVFVDGRTYRFEEVRGGSKGYEGFEGFEQGSRRVRSGSAHGAGSLAAPMPATVRRIVTAPGTAVRKGDTLIILEAMKMELPLRAPQDGTVSAVHCTEGQLVQPGVVLVELTEG